MLLINSSYFKAKVNKLQKVSFKPPSIVHYSRIRFFESSLCIFRPAGVALWVSELPQDQKTQV
jgi:hypothetical protein